MRWVAAALLVVGTLPAAQRPVVLDAFENTNGWRAQPADGISLRIASDSGFRGPCAPQCMLCQRINPLRAHR